MPSPLKAIDNAFKVYEDAVRHQKGGDDSTARRLVKTSLEQCPTDDARALLAWLDKYGDGTVFDQAAKRVLHAPDHYAVFELPKYSLVDDKEIHKRFLKLSRQHCP